MRLRYLLAAALMVTSWQPALAQSDQETLTGNWGGLRERLSNAGIELGGDEILDVQGNPIGGNRQGAAADGRFEAFATADLDKLLGWQGGLVRANAYQVQGRGLSADDLGNLLTVSNISAAPATRLFGLWLQQSLFDDRVSLRIGQIAADDEFFVSQYAGLFLNSAFGWPSILGVNLPSGGAAYPLAAPGVRLRVALSPALVATTEVVSGDPAPPGYGDPQRRDGDGLRFHWGDGALWLNELAYSTSIGAEALPGTWKIGAWWHTGDFADMRRDVLGGSLAAQAAPPLVHDGDFGGYVIFDQLLWRHGSGDQGLGAFMRIGGAPGDRNTVMLHVDGGFNYVGILPARPDDVIGLAVSYDQMGSAARALSRDIATLNGTDAPPADFETALELSYQAMVTPWWLVQPDAQLIFHPGARLAAPAKPPTAVPGNALVVGLRTAVSL